MSIKDASDALELVSRVHTLDAVMKDIEFAARRGRRSWLFSWLPEETCNELLKRGFHLNSTNSREYNVTVSW